MRDLHNNIGVVHLLDPQDIVASDTKSNILDRQGFESVELLAIIGAINTLSGSVYLTPVLQESDSTDDADFEAVDEDDIIGAFTKIDAANEDQVTQHVGYRGSKRYVRVLLDVTGNTVAALVSVIGLVSHAADRPVTAPAAVAAT